MLYKGPDEMILDGLGGRIAGTASGGLRLFAPTAALALLPGGGWLPPLATGTDEDSALVGHLSGRSWDRHLRLFGALSGP